MAQAAAERPGSHVSSQSAGGETMGDIEPDEDDDDDDDDDEDDDEDDDDDDDDDDDEFGDLENGLFSYHSKYCCIKISLINHCNTWTVILGFFILAVLSADDVGMSVEEELMGEHVQFVDDSEAMQNNPDFYQQVNTFVCTAILVSFLICVTLTSLRIQLLA